MAKKGKAKISKIKRNNQTTNKMKKQGKLKLQRHRQKIQKHKQPIQTQPEYSSESESSSNEWADMLDEEEQQYIAKRLAKQPQLLSNVPEEETKQGSKRKRKEKAPKSMKQQNLDMNNDSNSDSDTENSDMEEKYEHELAQRPTKKLRPLLPIKTKDGVQERAEECEESESDQENDSQIKENRNDGEDSKSDESDVEDNAEPDQPKPDNNEVTTVELLAARRDRLRHEKLRIGALCSSLLESPEKKLKNLFPILYLMEEKLKDGTLNLMSVRKLATLSAAEVFRDIIPDYKIRHQDYTDIKLKKDTLALYKYEKELLEFYKRYLQRLEKATNVLRGKKGDNRKPDESQMSLALVSLRSMCSMLAARPNFNYATNIAQSVVPLLGCRLPEAREEVTACCEQLFKEDSKGEITLTIVRLINQLVKRRGERLPPQALDCLLALDLRGVDLDRDADLRHKKKQEEKHKKRIINLSKKEKKRAKKLKEVERELLETQAQESQVARQKILTEVTKTVFHIYFRLLKSAPKSGLLSAALNGLAKFTHVINMEYYSDLVSILSRLLRDARVGRRPRLQCARAALALLAGAGDALNVDPAVFHDYVYASVLDCHAGSTAEDAPVLVEALWAVGARARRVSAGVLRALGKRAAAAALQLAPHAALAALALLRHLLLQSKAVSSLLDTEEGAGSGRYLPLLAAPEHCNAHAARAHELPALRRHHHPALRAAAAALLAGAWPPELANKTPMQILKEYDGSEMAFKPAVPPPKPNPPKSKPSNNWSSQDFKAYCTSIEDNVDLSFSDNVR
ncbi:unnamed protein product, partial [Brenthis ino]